MMCLIDGCDRVVLARGLCSRHYNRWLAHGDAAYPVQQRAAPGVPRRFIEELPPTGSGCIFWPFATTSNGYAQVSIGKGRKAHVSRIVCEKYHGAPPSNEHHAAHLCGNGHKACVSPWHLVWKTPKENSADLWVHGTRCHGEQHPNAKLTNKQAQAIRNSRQPQSVIAHQYGVSQSIVSKIKRGLRWAHINQLEKEGHAEGRTQGPEKQ